MRYDRLGRIVLSVTLGGGLALAAAGCGSSSSGAAPAHEAGPAARVRIVKVERSTDGLVEAPGVVAARERAALSARVPATIVALPFREGQAVARGAVVARLDDAALEAAVRAAEASSAATDTDAKRLEALLGRGAATPRERDEARARAEAARAALHLAHENLNYAVLRAPFDGVIAALPANVGDVASPGRTLVEVEGRAGLEIRATIDAALAAQVTAGAELLARVDGVREALTARVRSVAPAGDPATHRFDVRADIPAAPGLRSGLFARLAVPSAGAEPRLTLPARAVFRRGGLSGVFVVDSGRARLRWVAPGEERDGVIEVRAGLAAGERVALAPAGLRDGARVAEES